MENKPIVYDKINGVPVPVVYRDGTVHPDYESQLDVAVNGPDKVVSFLKELYIKHGREMEFTALSELWSDSKWAVFLERHKGFIRPSYWRRRRLTTVLTTLKIKVPDWAKTNSRHK